jgi:hypothetical protein
MTFDQLMEHANEIQSKATKHALDNHEQDPEYARNGVDGYFAAIPDLFKPFSELPDPGRYQPLIDDLKVVLHGLSNGDDNGDPIDAKDVYPANPTLTKMTTAGDYLEDWTGRAAMLFKQKFLDTFPAVCRNQFILVAVLKSALEAHQAMWASARKDIDDVAHNTSDALDNTGGLERQEFVELHLHGRVVHRRRRLGAARRRDPGPDHSPDGDRGGCRRAGPSHDSAGRPAGEAVR